MASSLLSHRINTLLLNAKSPFPSEIRDGQQMVKEWRHAQRKFRLVTVPADRTDDSDSDRGADGDDLGERQ
jgi:hypothetical protein